MIKYEDFTSCTDLNNWRARHIEINIINIETISQYPALFRVWYEG